MRGFWVYMQGILLVQTMMMLAARILAATVYWILGVDYDPGTSDPLVLAFIFALNLWPGVRLWTAWMHAHGIWRRE